MAVPRKGETSFDPRTLTLDTKTAIWGDSTKVFNCLRDELWGSVDAVAAEARFRRPEIKRFNGDPENFLRAYIDEHKDSTMRDFFRLLDESETGGIAQRRWPHLWDEFQGRKKFRASTDTDTDDGDCASPGPMSQPGRAARSYETMLFSELPLGVANAWMFVLTMNPEKVAAAAGMPAERVAVLKQDSSQAAVALSEWFVSAKITPSMLAASLPDLPILQTFSLCTKYNQ